MKISDVVITLANKRNNKDLKGWAKVTLSDSLIIKGIRIIENTDDKGTSRFIKFPEQVSYGGKPVLIVNAIDKEFRAQLTDKIFEEYDKLI